ncbi:MAG TPA: alpha/beta fold hydrolase [Conexibacter sp.]|nr:alpha/beta fold hydrolase [Conexibacter sp.]
MDGSPRDPVELAVVRAWQRCLKLERVGVEDDFRACGGTKAAALAIGEELRRALGAWLPPSALGVFPRVEQLAAVYRPLVPPERFAAPLPLHRASALEAAPVDPEDERDAFMVHGVGGEVVSVYGLASRLPPTWRVWGLELPSLRTGAHAPFDVPALARRHVATLRTLRRRGSIVLGGHSLGGLVAYEMARQLRGSELNVALLLLLDVEVPDGDPVPRRPVAYDREQREQLLERMCRAGFFPPGSTVDLLERFTSITHAMTDAAVAYEVAPLDQPAVHFRTAGYASEQVSERSTWEPYLGAGLRTEAIGGDHYTMYMPPHVESFAARVADCLPR